MTRPASRMAWTSWALASALAAAGLVLLVAFNRVALSPSAIVAFTFPTLGAMIASRHPRNPIGWLFSVAGLSAGLMLFSRQYAVFGLMEAPGSVPGATAAAWVSSWAWIPALGLVGTLCLLLFPDGRVPGKRWWPVLWAVVVGLALFLLGTALQPWGGEAGAAPAAGLPSLLSFALTLTPWEEVAYPIGNPLGVKGAEAALDMLTAIGGVLMLAGFIGSVASLIVRYRKARRLERQQLKVVAYAAGLVGVLYLATGWRGVADLVTGLSVSVLAVAIAVAILRHHLLDIDLVINRTLVYGALTAALGAVYVVGVVVLGSIVRALVGQGSNQVVVAASTLLVAALFQPLRGAIQAEVDRRFYRHRYDAARTLEAFSARLRQEVDLDTLSADLLSVVQETLEPTRMSLWLRPSAPPGGRVTVRPPAVP
ncbi:MAG: hypothetical protein M3N51_03020 [Actinomycetota bacterium]|nr:hypothetical protein [Actinomycetota bacterium]